MDVQSAAKSAETRIRQTRVACGGNIRESAIIAEEFAPLLAAKDTEDIRDVRIVALECSLKLAEAEVAELRRDAERYRYIKCDDQFCVMEQDRGCLISHVTSERMDAAIDAALAAKKV